MNGPGLDYYLLAVTNSVKTLGRLLADRRGREITIIFISFATTSTTYTCSRATRRQFNATTHLDSTRLDSTHPAQRITTSMFLHFESHQSRHFPSYRTSKTLKRPRSRRPHLATPTCRPTRRISHPCPYYRVHIDERRPRPRQRDRQRQ
jgi:hypothetical protein